MSQIVSDACNHGGAYNALKLSEFREILKFVDGFDKRQFLLFAFKATFELPGDASLEQAALQAAVTKLAKEWSK